MTDFAMTCPAGAAMAVVGMFDGVHRGHIHLMDGLRARAAMAGLRPLVVTFPNHPLEVVDAGKAPELLCSPQEKRELLEAAGVEIAMIPFDEELRRTPASEFIRMLHCRYGVEAMLLGFNNRFGYDAPRDFAEYVCMAQAEGVRIYAAGEYVHGGNRVSSTEIRRRLGHGDVAMAAELLGRPYALAGTVEHGRQVGRTIGFPTANLHPAARKLIPGKGVYAARAVLSDGSRHSAVVNIGLRPTVDRSEKPVQSVEAHLIGFAGDLYHERMVLEFVEKLRDEQRFRNLGELQARIAADVEKAQILLKDNS